MPIRGNFKNMARSLKGIGLVTFDATNTLLKFIQPPWDYYATVAQKYGYSGTGEDLKPLLLNSMNSMATVQPNFGCNGIKYEKWWEEVVSRTLQDKVLNEDLQDIAKELRLDYETPKCWCCAHGAFRLMKNIKSQDIMIGVVSNFDPRLHTILGHFNINNLIDFVLTSYECGFMKPDPKIFERALFLSNRYKLLHPYEVLHVGDNLEKDYEGARNAGWNAVIVNERLSVPTPINMVITQETERINKEHIFKSLDELNLAFKKDEFQLS